MSLTKLRESKAFGPPAIYILMVLMGAVRSKYKRCPQRRFKIMGNDVSNFHIKKNTRRKTQFSFHHKESRLGQNVHITNLEQGSFVSEVSNLVASQCSLDKRPISSLPIYANKNPPHKKIDFSDINSLKAGLKYVPAVTL